MPQQCEYTIPSCNWRLQRGAKWDKNYLAAKCCNACTCNCNCCC